MAQTDTQTATPQTDPAAPAPAGAAHAGADTFTDTGPKPGGPEIEATDADMGKNMVHEMNVVNGLDGGKYDINHGVKYSYNRQAELRRANKMDLWRDEYRLGHHYGDQFINPWENGQFMRFELKAGKSASEGIKAWLAGVTVAECNSAVVAMQIDTFRKAIGDTKFDAKFGSSDPTVDKGVSQRMVIKQGGDGTPIDQMLDQTELAKVSTTGPGRDPNNGTASEKEKEDLLKPGEWYYFYNHPKYLLKHPGGAWQGENSLYMGKNDKGERMWAGMGATDKTETTMVSEMVSAYGGDRDENDERALKESGAKTPDGKYTDTKYDPKGGVFPDQVTAEQILNDPPYDIDGTTRKGGFLPAAGMSLNPTKVKAVRDK
jgi:hypothetical protein